MYSVARECDNGRVDPKVLLLSDSVFFFVNLSIWQHKFLANHNLCGYNFQDCAGVILSTAERATQVALQVKDSGLIPFYLSTFATK